MEKRHPLTVAGLDQLGRFLDQGFYPALTASRSSWAPAALFYGLSKAFAFKTPKIFALTHQMLVEPLSGLACIWR